MPWFWDLISSIGSDPCQAPSTKDLVTQPFDGLLQQNLRNLNLHAWLLEPLPFRNKGSLKKCSSDFQPEPFTNHSGPFLSNGVSQTRCHDPKWTREYSDSSCSSSSTRWVRTQISLSVLTVHSGRVCTKKKRGRVFCLGLVDLTISLVTLITNQSFWEFPLFSYPPSTG